MEFVWKRRVQEVWFAAVAVAKCECMGASNVHVDLAGRSVQQWFSMMHVALQLATSRPRGVRSAALIVVGAAVVVQLPPPPPPPQMVIFPPIVLPNHAGACRQRMEALVTCLNS